MSEGLFPLPRCLTNSRSQSNLWLADTLWRLGAVQFGDFTLGRTTVHSPIHVNLRLLIAHPTALARAAHIVLQELQTLQAMRNPQVDPFDLVCGVPFGGLVVGEAFSLSAKVPLIYLHPHKDDLESDVEGLYHPSQTALIMDDLITGGGSIILTANRLRDEGPVRARRASCSSTGSPAAARSSTSTASGSSRS